MQAAEVAVVGGGVLALAITQRLAAGGLDVRVVAPVEEPRRSASRAAGAMLGVFSEVSSYDDPVRRTLDVAERLLARRSYDPWLEELGLAVTPGLFVIANPEGREDAAELAVIEEVAAEFGGAAQRVGARDIPGLAPDARCPAYAAIHLADEGTIDADQLMEALERATANRRIATTVERIELGDTGQVTLRLGDGEVLTAEQVVLAAGVGTAALVSDVELGLPALFGGRGVSLLLRSAVELPTGVRTPNRAFACGLHVLPRGDGTLYVGATNRLSTAPDLARQATLGEVDTLLRGAVAEVSTGLRDAELLAVQVGHRAVTADHLPLVGRSQDSRVLFATGTYRNGMLLAPRVAELIGAELSMPGSQRSHPWSPRRAVLPADLGAVLSRAAAGLVTTGIGSSAQPWGRDRELARVVEVTLGLLTGGEVDRDRLARKLSRLLERAPMEEALPLLFDLVARHGER